MSDTTAKPQHYKTPAWVNLTIVALILLAGAWAVWQFGIKSPTAKAKPTKEVLAGKNGSSRGPGRLAMANQQQRPERPPRNNDELRVKSSGDVGGRRGDLVFNVTKSADGFGRIYLDSARRDNWVSSAEYKLHLLSYRLAATPKMAAAVGLTPEQKAKLDALPYTIVLSPEEETTLKTVFTAWSANPKSDAEKAKVYAALDEVAKVHLPKLEAAFKARVKAIPEIVTPEQITKATEWANPPKAAPTTKPATGNFAKLPE
jgi:hypothetical protein